MSDREILSFVWLAWLSIGVISERFWSIYRMVERSDWPAAYFPVWLNMKRLYALSCLEAIMTVVFGALVWSNQGLVLASILVVATIFGRDWIVDLTMKEWLESQVQFEDCEEEAELDADVVGERDRVG